MTARDLSCAAALVMYAVGAGPGDQSKPDPKSFETRAIFSIDKDAMTLTSVAATIEPRPGAPGYSWVRIHFYAFPFTAADTAGAVKGRLESMDARSTNKASNPKEYNHSNAVIQLGVDKAFKVWQIDMSVPGHACTIAAYERDVKSAVQEYGFDGRQLRLKSKGSFVCDMGSPGIPNRRYGWDLDLDIPVYQKGA
jgi:hypothetical protein